MALEIAKTFTIKAPPDAVWAFLVDVKRVASCMPGAAITSQVDDRTYTGTMTVKVGPVSSSYRGKIVFDKLDAAARVAEIVATGQDVKGKGGADLRLSSVLKQLGPVETEVVTVSQVNITGVLAQMGRGMIQDVSDQMFSLFSERMRSELEAGATAAAAEAPTPAGPAAAPPLDAPTGAAVPPPSAAPSAAAVPAPAAPAPAVLDLGAIGTRAARNAALRSLASPLFWLIALAVGVVVYLLLH